MELKKAKGRNNYTLKGLTLGQLMAIQEATAITAKNGNPVAYDVFRFLELEKLEEHEPFK